MKTFLAEIRACALCAAHLPDPPRPILAAHSQSRILLIGQAPGRKVLETGIPWSAQRHYLGEGCRDTVTENVRDFRAFLPDAFPLVHPSPRNKVWHKRNPWFETGVLPELRKRVRAALSPDSG
jgi:uracil-DNA glycosylase